MQLKILLSNSSFDTKDGGPPVSVSQLSISLSEIGVEVGVWAPNDGAIHTSLFDQPEAANVQRLKGGITEALAAFGTPDIIHDNGIWLPHNHSIASLSRRIDVPRVISVRGMLEPWALNQKKVKKWIAWQAYQKRDMQSAARIHATAHAESNSVERSGVHVPTVVIPNGAHIPEESEFVEDKSSKRTALFLSRIHPKKGVPMLIKAWEQIRPSNWSLRIVGPGSGRHLAEVKKLVEESGIGEDVSFFGPLHGEEKQRAYFDADLFILPTYSENFGIVIAEALASGVPVITTTGTPWQELHTYECGWWVEPDVVSIAGALRAATQPGLDLKSMGRRGRTHIQARYGWASIASSFVNLYQGVLKEATGS